MEKRVCIVNNNKFEAIYYESNDCPLNFVLGLPNGKTWNNSYLLINTDVTVSWQDYYNPSGYRVLKVIYKNTTLLIKHNISNIQFVIDVLNKFNTISKIELEQLLAQSQEKEMSELEIKIEKLRKEKSSLENEMKIYKEIQIKKNEIKNLLEKLK